MKQISVTADEIPMKPSTSSANVPSTSRAQQLRDAHMEQRLALSRSTPPTGPNDALLDMKPTGQGWTGSMLTRVGKGAADKSSNTSDESAERKLNQKNSDNLDSSNSGKTPVAGKLAGRRTDKSAHSQYESLRPDLSSRAVIKIEGTTADPETRRSGTENAEVKVLEVCSTRKVLSLPCPYVALSLAPPSLPHPLSSSLTHALLTLLSYPSLFLYHISYLNQQRDGTAPCLKLLSHWVGALIVLSISKALIGCRCVYPGLSPDLQSMEQIRRIMRPTDVPDNGLLCDLLWSDPDKETMGWGENDRGVSFTFGSEVVAKFLHKHDLDLICRAHQVGDGNHGSPLAVSHLE